MVSAFQILNVLGGGHALPHARQQVDKAGCGVHAGIHRDPSNRLTGGDHVQPAAHESPAMGLRVSGGSTM